MISPKGPILVIGATGNQGGQVAQALLAYGYTVHALTRNPQSTKAQALSAHGAHLVKGNLADLPTLTQAFQDVSGIFSVQNFWDLGRKEEVRLGIHVIQAAKAARNSTHIVYSSGLGAHTLQGVAAIDGKTLIEAQLRRSGLPFTILRPGLFMDDFLGASLPFAQPIQTLLNNYRPLVGRLFLATLRSLMPQGSYVPLTTLGDVGRMTAWAFSHPNQSHGQTFEIVGSRETLDTVCGLWYQKTGQQIPYIPGMSVGLLMAHHRMASLLHWIRRHTVMLSDLPITLTSYESWLEEAFPSVNNR